MCRVLLTHEIMCRYYIYISSTSDSALMRDRQVCVWQYFLVFQSLLWQKELWKQKRDTLRSRHHRQVTLCYYYCINLRPRTESCVKSISRPNNAAGRAWMKAGTFPGHSRKIQRLWLYVLTLAINPRNVLLLNLHPTGGLSRLHLFRFPASPGQVWTDLRML